MHSSHTSPSLATRFARNTFVLRSETPLAEDQMRQAAPSIFASGKHVSRSERYPCGCWPWACAGAGGQGRPSSM